MATIPVDSDGARSAPSPMVAVPGAREAPVILGTGIGMSMPKMECKINLRGGNQDAWRRWLVNRNDVITAHGLDALMDNQLMPTLEVIGERFPSLSSAERQETLVASTKQYLSENTKLYFLMKDSVDISGAYEQLDTDHINKSFVGAAGSRSLRDGLGFLNWVEGFFDITKDDAQIMLKQQFTSKMKVNSTGVSIATLEKTWLDGLSIWKRITGNNEYDRVSLQTYYLAIRDGLPDKPFEAPLVRLRQWLAERLHDMSPIYDNPAKAISAILGFAEVLNLPTKDWP